jgi:AcrR family transcriptional regulator
LSGNGAQKAEIWRRAPQQDRSKEKVDWILEAAAQLLEKKGAAGFNTNAVAERAGVSIGTLYRYFPDKQTILTELAKREMAKLRTAVRGIVEKGGEGLAQDRALIRAFLRAFGGRAKARRVVMRAWFASADAVAFEDRPADGPVFTDAQNKPLSPIASYVHSRALLGAMRAAVLEGVSFLQSQAFEDELVRLSCTFRGYGDTRRK